MNCGGLHADRIARAMGANDVDGIRIVPFRGEYYELDEAATPLVRALIYPVPDPRFPFLGVHLTKGIGGHIHAGPNAVLGLAREGYSWRAVDRHDLTETLRFSGFQHLARRYWRYGLHETVRSLSTRSFTGPCSDSFRRCASRTCGGHRPASAPRRSSRTGPWPTTSSSARTGRCSTCSTLRRRPRRPRWRSDGSSPSGSSP